MMTTAVPARGADDLGLKVPGGFRVTVLADETLANDTYAMALDAKGRVVVTTRLSTARAASKRGPCMRPLAGMVSSPRRREVTRKGRAVRLPGGHTRRRKRSAELDLTGFAPPS